MGKDFYESSTAAREVFQEANKVLKMDLASICFNGPQEKLNQTDISQPAIFTTSVAAFRAGCHAGIIDPQGIKAYAGLSLGEYTALHLARVFSFEDGLKLVAARGKYMQEAADANPSGMVAVLGADEKTINSLCEQCAAGEALVAANFNAPGQIVVSGTLAACDRLISEAEKAGLKTVKLAVAGAFHSPLMQSAADKMRSALEHVKFADARAAVYANVTAKPHSDTASMKKLLVDQVVSAVRWEQTMQNLLSAGEWRFVELAPGRSLTGMLKKINRRLPVESLAGADGLTAAKSST
jgi:[acyl-carrier-protein] S-malonyltransferase